MKTKLLTMAVLATVLASCQNENEVVQTGANFPEDGVIRIHAGVNDLRARGTYSTNDLSNFGICIKNADSPTYSYNNISVTRSNGTAWTSAETMLWQSAEQAVDIVAYAPYNAGASYTALTTDVAANVQAVQTEADKSSDFLIYKAAGFVPETGLTDGKVKIDFSHAMSRLVVEITLGTEFYQLSIPGSNPLKEVAVNGTVIEGTCDFSVPAPAVSPKTDAGAAAVTPYETGFQQAASASERCVVTYECILIPQTVSASGFSVTFKINDKKYRWTSKDAITLEKGVSYTLPLTVGKDVVQTVSMTSTPWTEETTNGNLVTE